MSTLFIVCEGEKTEPLYFKNYITRENNVKIKTVTCSNKDAIGILDYAIKMIGMGKFSTEGKDEVICVFDCDANTDDDLAKAFKYAREKKVKICLSNPSFEIWFILHYNYVERLFTKELLKSELKKHIPNYMKNMNYYDELLSKRDNAIDNAGKLNGYHSSQGTSLESVKSNPSTQVHEVIALIHGFNKK
ncbi:MAG: RloB family protein [Methanosarcinaceae archaeon]